MISNKTFEIEIVTPTRTRFQGEVNELVIPGVMGEMAILASHAPLLTMLDPGVIAYEDSSGTKEFATGAGFASIADNKAVCLVDFALSAEEIDKEAAQAERNEVLKKLNEAGPNADLLREQLKAANAKLRIAG